MDSLRLQKYKYAGFICKIVFNKLKKEICKNNQTDISYLINLGNKLLLEECDKLVDKHSLNNINKITIGFPTCISLNNCVGYYSYEKDNVEYNEIKPNDLVKIELGLNIDDCINIYGDSFFYESNERNEQIFKLLQRLESKITKMMKVDNTNDDIRMLIESYCTESNCFPVENTFSYQHLDNHIQSEESKYIVTNYNKYYDEHDALLVSPNICFDLEENEIYTINLTIIENKKDENDHMYKELHKPHIFKYNEYFHNFKLQSSKQFYSLIKKNHGVNPFSMTDYNNNVKNRMGFKESFDNCILNYYPVLYNKEKLPVFFKKFSVIVAKERGINLSETLENEF